MVKYAISVVDPNISTNAKYGFYVNKKGCVQPIDDNNIKDIWFFDTKEEAEKEAKYLPGSIVVGVGENTNEED